LPVPSTREPVLEPIVNRTARTAGALLAATCLVLAGCGRTEVQNAYAPGDGSQVTTQQVALRNVLVVTNGSGSNAVIASAANLTSVPDFLDEVSAGGTAFTKGSVPLAPFGAVYFGSTDRPAIPVAGTATPGGYVDLVFTFRNAGDVPISALVVPNTGEYAGVIERAQGLPEEAVQAAIEADAAAREAAEAEAEAAGHGGDEEGEAATEPATGEGAPSEGAEPAE
jgi:hypothetical protein